MLLRPFSCLQLFMLAWLAMPLPHALAQSRDAGDQPGYIPTADEEQLDPKYQRTMVFYRTSANCRARSSFRPRNGFSMSCSRAGRALRYGIGVGRQGFQWQGLLKISRKQEWPDWTPPEEMIQRQPYLPRWMGGRPRQSARCACALSGPPVYRIHGTNQPQTIGNGGVVRMLPSGQWRRHRSVRSNSGRHQGCRPTATGALTERPRCLPGPAASMLREGGKTCASFSR